jgi:hypothetical protein
MTADSENLQHDVQHIRAHGLGSGFQRDLPASPENAFRALRQRKLSRLIRISPRGGDRNSESDLSQRKVAFPPPSY